jgi:hypothetical protein
MTLLNITSTQKRVEAEIEKPAEGKSELYKVQAAAYVKWRPTYPSTFSR